ncbi:MAG: putative zinc-binding protein [Planctomycetota bacterium]|jgi:uncharacterized metal-binding protein
MSDETSNQCAGSPKRKMTENGSGRMFCLAGIGGRVSGIMEKTEAASRILAIDGCELDCVKSCLEQAGFRRFDHLRVTDLGMQKGHSAASAENVGIVAEHGAALLV